MNAYIEYKESTDLNVTKYDSEMKVAHEIKAIGCLYSEIPKLNANQIESKTCLTNILNF